MFNHLYSRFLIRGVGVDKPWQIKDGGGILIFVLDFTHDLQGVSRLYLRKSKRFFQALAHRLVSDICQQYRNRSKTYSWIRNITKRKLDAACVPRTS